MSKTIGTIIYPPPSGNCVGAVTKEIFIKKVDLGLLKIEITIFENVGCRVYLTATDNQNRRLWKTPLTDKDGNVKIFESLKEAVVEAQQKITSSFKNQTYLSVLNPDL